jgi:hypothetical protein
MVEKNQLGYLACSIRSYCLQNYHFVIIADFELGTDHLAFLLVELASVT